MPQIHQVQINDKRIASCKRVELPTSPTKANLSQGTEAIDLMQISSIFSR